MVRGRNMEASVRGEEGESQRVKEKIRCGDAENVEERGENSKAPAGKAPRPLHWRTASRVVTDLMLTGAAGGSGGRRGRVLGRLLFRRLGGLHRARQLLLTALRVLPSRAGIRLCVGRLLLLAWSRERRWGRAARLWP